MPLQPLAVGGDGEVGIGDVVEGTIDREAIDRCVLVLVAASFVGDRMPLGNRGTEPFRLLVPLRAAWRDVEQGAQEVLR